MENRKSLRSPCIPVYLHTCIPVLLGSFLFLLGCSKPQNDSDMVRRAQLVGNENLQLKKDIADKDKQISELTKQVEKAQAENAAIEEQHADIYKKLMDIILECNSKLEKYEQPADSNQPPATSN